MNKRNKIFLGIIFFVIFSGSLIYFISSSSGTIYHNSSPDTLYAQKLNNNDEITKQRRNIITETVKRVSPAVVGINVTEVREYRDPFSSYFDDPFFRQFFGNRGNRKQQVKGLGSGYIVSSDGYIITNDHVAGNATEITVTMTNGKHYKAKLIGSDATSDICLLKIEESNLPYVLLGNSNDIIIGEWVIALGNPFGLFELNDQPTVTVGVISATNMNLEPINERYYLNMIQTDASINGGNSGGPLVNSLGEVIGMNTLIFTAGGNQGSIGLGFAIPINKVKKIIDELKNKGKIERDFNIGLRIQTIDDEIAKYYSLETNRGVIITQVIPNSPAEKAGIKSGDIVTQIEGFRITNENNLISVFQEFRTGQTININILRDEKPITLKMKLEKS